MCFRIPGADACFPSHSQDFHSFSNYRVDLHELLFAVLSQWSDQDEGAASLRDAWQHWTLQESAVGEVEGKLQPAGLNISESLLAIIFNRASISGLKDSWKLHATMWLDSEQLHIADKEPPRHSWHWISSHFSNARTIHWSGCKNCFKTLTVTPIYSLLRRWNVFVTTRPGSSIGCVKTMCSSAIRYESSALIKCCGCVKDTNINSKHSTKFSRTFRAFTLRIAGDELRVANQFSMKVSYEFAIMFLSFGGFFFVIND